MMTRLIFVLYAIFITASTVQAETKPAIPACHPDEARTTTLKDAARGMFSGLVFAEKPYYAGELKFHDQNSKTLELNAFQGKILAVNMWAMWCAPCRAEMADLAKLSNQSSGDDFEVIAINMDGDTVENTAIEAFLTEVSATNLKLYRDEKMEIFRKLRRDIPARGLPLTLILDARGCAVASYAGAAPWGNEDAAHFISTLIAYQHSIIGQD